MKRKRKGAPVWMRSTALATGAIGLVSFGAWTCRDGTKPIDHAALRKELEQGIYVSAISGHESRPVPPTVIRERSADVPNPEPDEPGPGAGEMLASNDWVWSEPVNLGPRINTKEGEQHLSVAAGGCVIAFTRGGDLFFSRRASDKDLFRRAFALNTVNGADSWDGAPAMTQDGLVLFFESDRLSKSREARMQDIWVSARSSIRSTFANPVPLARPLNTEAHDANPWISQDGLTLLFESDRDGYTALFECRRDSIDDPFGEPGKLKPSGGQPCLSADGLILLFDSTRSGGEGESDLWLSRRASRGAPFEDPVNLGKVINTAAGERDPGLTPDGRRLYFSSDRPGGLGGFDLWYSDRVRRESGTSG